MITTPKSRNLSFRNVVKHANKITQMRVGMWGLKKCGRNASVGVRTNVITHAKREH